MKKFQIGSILLYIYLLGFLPNLPLNAMGALQSFQSSEKLIDESERLKWIDPDSAIYLLKARLLDLTVNLDALERADLALQVSKIFNEKRACDSIGRWNKIAYDIYQAQDNRRGLAEVYYQDGYEQFCLGQHEKALDFVLKGLEIMEDIGNQPGIALGYLRMARIFHFTYKLGESAESGVKAGTIFETLKIFPEAWDAWSFAGHGYRMENDSTQAEYCFAKGLEMAEKSGLPKVIGLAYNDLASFYMEFNQYDSAVNYFEKALHNADPADERQVMVIKNGLGQVYLATGRYQECIDLLKEALDVVYRTNEIFFLTELPEYIAQSYAALGQYDSAYKYMEMNWRYSDSLFTINQDQAMEEMKSKYESDQKDALIAQQKSERKYIYSLLFLALVVAFMFYWRYQLKKQTNEILDQRNKEKDYLLREIHHRVKNNLQILSSLLNLQADYMQDESALNALTEGRNRVQSMSFIHQQLYSEENVSMVDMKEYVTLLCEHLRDSFSLDNNGIRITYQVDVPFFDVETAIPIGLIINELITNSIKYAFPEPTVGEIKVRLWIGENEKLFLQVRDNGSGVSIHKEGSSSSFGTDLINVLSQKLRGKIEVNRDDGYSTTIEFSRFKTIDRRDIED
ncbi:MAG: tetratricopeptide repeat protein [Saprospiraceae bacterium]|nr:tetratricopeptide repeat protein [Saprospiraceae bacterium]